MDSLEGQIFPDFLIRKMEDTLVDLLRWHLQIRWFDHVEFTPFRSRCEAMEHAQALLRDYGPWIGLTLGSPWGVTEALQESPLSRAV